MRAAALLLLLTSAPALAETLTLDEAVRMARAHHPTVEQQRGQVIVAGGRREQALAKLLPSLQGSFGYVPQTSNLVATPQLTRELITSTGQDHVVDAAGVNTLVTCRTPGVGNCMPLPAAPTSWALQNFWTMQVGLSWTLFDWGTSIYGYKSARRVVAAAEVGVHTAQRNVVLDAKVAFFTALAAEEQLVVSRDAVRTYAAHVEQTRAFHDTGLRTGIDVATVESALASAGFTLARAVAARETARAALAAALGEDHPPDWQLVADPNLFDFRPDDTQRTVTSEDTLTDVALRQRTELTELRLQETSAVDLVKAARGAYLPALTLNAGPSWAAGSLADLTPNLTFTIAIGYPTSGMSPLAVHGQVREAEGNVAITRAQVRAERDAIRQDVVGGRAQLAAAREEMLAAVTAVKTAARQRELAEGRYSNGVGNVIELEDALLTDVNARFQLVQARLDIATARARLQHALGEDN
ncbi:MAG TPA: TolC family protein [Polyangia bacterium]|nr:TolC family protein [Polyangia bacterium]